MRATIAYSTKKWPIWRAVVFFAVVSVVLLTRQCASEEEEDDDLMPSISCIIFGNRGCLIKCGILCKIYKCEASEPACDGVYCDCHEKFTPLTLSQLQATPSEDLPFKDLLSIKFLRTPVFVPLIKLMRDDPDTKEKMVQFLRTRPGYGKEFKKALLERFSELKLLKRLKPRPLMTEDVGADVIRAQLVTNKPSGWGSWSSLWPGSSADDVSAFDVNSEANKLRVIDSICGIKTKDDLLHTLRVLKNEEKPLYVDVLKYFMLNGLTMPDGTRVIEPVYNLKTMAGYIENDQVLEDLQRMVDEDRKRRLSKTGDGDESDQQPRNIRKKIKRKVRRRKKKTNEDEEANLSDENIQHPVNAVTDDHSSPAEKPKRKIKRRKKKLKSDDSAEPENEPPPDLSEDFGGDHHRPSSHTRPNADLEHDILEKMYGKILPVRIRPPGFDESTYSGETASDTPKRDNLKRLKPLDSEQGSGKRGRKRKPIKPIEEVSEHPKTEEWKTKPDSTAASDEESEMSNSVPTVIVMPTVLDTDSEDESEAQPEPDGQQADHGSNGAFGPSSGGPNSTSEPDQENFSPGNELDDNLGANDGMVLAAEKLNPGGMNGNAPHWAGTPRPKGEVNESESEDDEELDLGAGGKPLAGTPTPEGEADESDSEDDEEFDHGAGGKPLIGKPTPTGEADESESTDDEKLDHGAGGKPLIEKPTPTGEADESESTDDEELDHGAGGKPLAGMPKVEGEADESESGLNDNKPDLTQPGGETGDHGTNGIPNLVDLFPGHKQLSHNPTVHTSESDDDDLDTGTAPNYHENANSLPGDANSDGNDREDEENSNPLSIHYPEHAHQAAEAGEALPTGENDKSDWEDEENISPLSIHHPEHVHQAAKSGEALPAAEKDVSDWEDEVSPLSLHHPEHTDQAAEAGEILPAGENDESDWQDENTSPSRIHHPELAHQTTKAGGILSAGENDESDWEDEENTRPSSIHHPEHAHEAAEIGGVLPAGENDEDDWQDEGNTSPLSIHHPELAHQVAKGGEALPLGENDESDWEDEVGPLSLHHPEHTHQAPKGGEALSAGENDESDWQDENTSPSRIHHPELAHQTTKAGGILPAGENDESDWEDEENTRPSSIHHPEHAHEAAEIGGVLPAGENDEDDWQDEGNTSPSSIHHPELAHQVAKGGEALPPGENDESDWEDEENTGPLITHHLVQALPARENADEDSGDISSLEDESSLPAQAAAGLLVPENKAAHQIGQPLSAEPSDESIFDEANGGIHPSGSGGQQTHSTDHDDQDHEENLMAPQDDNLDIESPEKDELLPQAMHASQKPTTGASNMPVSDLESDKSDFETSADEDSFTPHTNLPTIPPSGSRDKGLPHVTHHPALPVADKLNSKLLSQTLMNTDQDYTDEEDDSLGDDDIHPTKKHKKKRRKKRRKKPGHGSGIDVNLPAGAHNPSDYDAESSEGYLGNLFDKPENENPHSEQPSAEVHQSEEGSSGEVSYFGSLFDDEPGNKAGSPYSDIAGLPKRTTKPTFEDDSNDENHFGNQFDTPGGAAGLDSGTSSPNTGAAGLPKQTNKPWFEDASSGEGYLGDLFDTPHAIGSLPTNTDPLASRTDQGVGTDVHHTPHSETADEDSWDTSDGHNDFEEAPLTSEDKLALGEDLKEALGSDEDMGAFSDITDPHYKPLDTTQTTHDDDTGAGSSNFSPGHSNAEAIHSAPWDDYADNDDENAEESLTAADKLALGKDLEEVLGSDEDMLDAFSDMTNAHLEQPDSQSHQPGSWSNPHPSESYTDEDISAPISYHYPSKPVPAATNNPKESVAIPTDPTESENDSSLDRFFNLGHDLGDEVESVEQPSGASPENDSSLEFFNLDAPKPGITADGSDANDDGDDVPYEINPTHADPAAEAKKKKKWTDYIVDPLKQLVHRNNPSKPTAGDHHSNGVNLPSTLMPGLATSVPHSPPTSIPGSLPTTGSNDLPSSMLGSSPTPWSGGSQTSQPAGMPTSTSSLPTSMLSGLPTSMTNSLPTSMPGGFQPSTLGSLPTVASKGLPDSISGGFQPSTLSGLPNSMTNGLPTSMPDGFRPSTLSDLPTAASNNSPESIFEPGSPLDETASDWSSPAGSSVKFIDSPIHSSDDGDDELDHTLTDSGETAGVIPGVEIGQPSLGALGSQNPPSKSAASSPTSTASSNAKPGAHSPYSGLRPVRPQIGDSDEQPDDLDNLDVDRKTPAGLSPVIEAKKRRKWTDYITDPLNKLIHRNKKDQPTIPVQDHTPHSSPSEKLTPNQKVAAGLNPVNHNSFGSDPHQMDSEGPETDASLESFFNLDKPQVEDELNAKPPALNDLLSSGPTHEDHEDASEPVSHTPVTELHDDELYSGEDDPLGLHHPESPMADESTHFDGGVENRNQESDIPAAATSNLPDDVHPSILGEEVTASPQNLPSMSSDPSHASTVASNSKPGGHSPYSGLRPARPQISDSDEQPDDLDTDRKSPAGLSPVIEAKKRRKWTDYITDPLNKLIHRNKKDQPATPVQDHTPPNSPSEKLTPSPIVAPVPNPASHDGFGSDPHQMNSEEPETDASLESFFNLNNPEVEDEWNAKPPTLEDFLSSGPTHEDHEDASEPVSHTPVTELHDDEPYYDEDDPLGLHHSESPTAGESSNFDGGVENLHQESDIPAAATSALLDDVHPSILGEEGTASPQKPSPMTADSSPGSTVASNVKPVAHSPYNSLRPARPKIDDSDEQHDDLDSDRKTPTGLSPVIEAKKRRKWTDYITEPINKLIHRNKKDQPTTTVQDQTPHSSPSEKPTPNQKVATAPNLANHNNFGSDPHQMDSEDPKTDTSLESFFNLNPSQVENEWNARPPALEDFLPSGPTHEDHEDTSEPVSHTPVTELHDDELYSGEDDPLGLHHPESPMAGESTHFDGGVENLDQESGIPAAETSALLEDVHPSTLGEAGTANYPQGATPELDSIPEDKDTENDVEDDEEISLPPGSSPAADAKKKKKWTDYVTEPINKLIHRKPKDQAVAASESRSGSPLANSSANPDAATAKGVVSPVVSNSKSPFGKDEAPSKTASAVNFPMAATSVTPSQQPEEAESPEVDELDSFFNLPGHELSDIDADPLKTPSVDDEDVSSPISHTPLKSEDTEFFSTESDFHENPDSLKNSAGSLDKVNGNPSLGKSEIPAIGKDDSEAVDDMVAASPAAVSAPAAAAKKGRWTDFIKKPIDKLLHRDKPQSQASPQGATSPAAVPAQPVDRKLVGEAGNAISKAPVPATPTGSPATSVHLPTASPSEANSSPETNASLEFFNLPVKNDETSHEAHSDQDTSSPIPYSSVPGIDHDYLDAFNGEDFIGIPTIESIVPVSAIAGSNAETTSGTPATLPPKKPSWREQFNIPSKVPKLTSSTPAAATASSNPAGAHSTPAPAPAAVANNKKWTDYVTEPVNKLVHRNQPVGQGAGSAATGHSQPSTTEPAKAAPLTPPKKVQSWRDEFNVPARLASAMTRPGGSNSSPGLEAANGTPAAAGKPINGPQPVTTSTSGRPMGSAQKPSWREQFKIPAIPKVEMNGRQMGPDFGKMTGYRGPWS